MGCSEDHFSEECNAFERGHPIKHRGFYFRSTDSNCKLFGQVKMQRHCNLCFAAVSLTALRIFRLSYTRQRAPLQRPVKVPIGLLVNFGYTLLTCTDEEQVLIHTLSFTSATKYSRLNTLTCKFVL